MKKKTSERLLHQKSKFERDAIARERFLILTRRINSNSIYTTIARFVKEKNVEPLKT